MNQQSSNEIQPNPLVPVIIVAAFLLVGLGGFAAFSFYKMAQANAAKAVAAEKRAELERLRNKAMVEHLSEMIDENDPTSVDEVSVREVLTAAETQLEQNFKDNPRVAADLRVTIGKSQLALGEFATARDNLVAAFDFYEENGGPDARRSEAAKLLATLFEQWAEAEPAAGHSESATHWRSLIEDATEDEAEE